MGKEQLLQYNIDYDRYEPDRDFIMTQLETHLKERFNVLVSTIEYEIEDGHLVRKGSKEPFINSIERGREVIQRLALNPLDLDRENAEVIGFGEKIDPFFSNPKTSLGSKMLSISLRGEKSSKYQHNFYDIFTLRARDGKRYVKMSRYSSALTAEDYVFHLGLDSENPPSAAEFLANPILIDNIFITSEQIHQKLHKEHEYMKPSDFEAIWEVVQHSIFIQRYLSNRDAKSFNAILSFADHVWENNKKREKNQKYRDYIKYVPSYKEIRYFEEKEVRQTSGGCPGKSGADINKSPFSVSEYGNLSQAIFGEDFGYEFDQDGPCKNCGDDVKCGPCGLCRSCDLEIRRKQSFKIAA